VLPRPTTVTTIAVTTSQPALDFIGHLGE